MTDSAGVTFDGLVERLDRAMLPFAGKVSYGNLRRKVTNWGEGNEATQNLAVIYESPGGSTNQINISYRPTAETFVTVDPEDGSETTTSDTEELVALVLRHVDTIPGYRLQRLEQQVDEWHEAGYSQPHIFAGLNDMLQSDFKGGSITDEELQHAIRYAVKLLRGASKDA